MNIQRLRNLTTGRLHTEIGHIYEDLGIITGETGLMTHMLPRAMRACEPWLREHVTDPRFWDGEYDPTEDAADLRRELCPPKHYHPRCHDRMCGATDCPNCHPENFEVVDGAWILIEGEE